MIIVDNAGVILLLKTVGVGLILLLLLNVTSVIFVVFTICGHRLAASLFPASTEGATTKRPAWLYRGFTSYEQTEWLHNTVLVKKISCLASQSEPVGRHAATTLQEKESADNQKAVCENMPLPSPQRCYAKTNNRKRPTLLYRGFIF